MEDVIEVSLDIDELGDIIFDEAKAFVSYEVGDILHVPGEKVIHADNLVSLLDKVIAEVRAQETHPTCNQCPLHEKYLLGIFILPIIALGICKGDLFRGQQAPQEVKAEVKVKAEKKPVLRLARNRSEVRG